MRGKCGAQISAFPSCSWRCRLQRAFARRVRQSLPAPQRRAALSKPFCRAGRRGSCRKSCADKGRRKRQPEAAWAQHALGLKCRYHQLLTVLHCGLQYLHEMEREPSLAHCWSTPCKGLRTASSFCLCLMARCTSVTTVQIIHKTN